MATFMELSPNPFIGSFQGLASDIQNDISQDRTQPLSSGRFRAVRRPVRGIQIKDDTFATLQVRTADGHNLPLFDAGGSVTSDQNPQGGRTYQYSNFLIQKLSEARQEKTQIVQTFGETYIFFYGEHPRVLQVQGVLLNSQDFNWRSEWWANYDTYLRGTQCVTMKTRVYLSWDTILTEGYITDASAEESSESPNYVNFSFTIFLTNYQDLSSIGDPVFPKSGTEVNLDPNTVDATGSGLGTLHSSTLDVRALNQPSDLTTEDLLGAIIGGVSFAVSLGAGIASGGGLGFGLSLAIGGLDIESLLEGRLVRVPIGFAGGSVFDDVQTALASVPITSTGQVTLTQSQLGDFQFASVADIPATFAPARYGLISLNVDEYIGRSPNNPIGPTQAPDIFAAQRASEGDAIDQVQAIFEAFGVDTDPPSEALVAITHLAFETVAITIGAALL